MSCNLSEFTFAYEVSATLEDQFERLEMKRCKTCYTPEEFKDRLEESDLILEGFGGLWYDFIHGKDDNV